MAPRAKRVAEERGRQQQIALRCERRDALLDCRAEHAVTKTNDTFGPRPLDLRGQVAWRKRSPRWSSAFVASSREGDTTRGVARVCRRRVRSHGARSRARRAAPDWEHGAQHRRQRRVPCGTASRRSPRPRKTPRSLRSSQRTTRSLVLTLRCREAPPARFAVERFCPRPYGRQPAPIRSGSSPFSSPRPRFVRLPSYQPQSTPTIPR